MTLQDRQAFDAVAAFMEHHDQCPDRAGAAGYGQHFAFAPDDAHCDIAITCHACDTTLRRRVSARLGDALQCGALLHATDAVFYNDDEVH